MDLSGSSMPVSEVDPSTIAQLEEAAAGVERLAAAVAAADHTSYGSQLRQVCEYAVATVEGADMAGVTTIGAGPPTTAAVTDSIAFDLDRDQYATDQGPCLDAARLGVVVRANKRESADRWPDFVAHAASSPVESFLSVPVSAGDGVSASLNLYSLAVDGFDTVDDGLLRVYEVSIGMVVRCSHASDASKLQLDTLRAAMTSRAAIEQAKGVIMAVQGISSSAAYEVLARRAQDENIEVADLAQSIVHSISSSNMPRRRVKRR